MNIPSHSLQTGTEWLSEEEMSFPSLKTLTTVSVLLFVYQQKPLEESASPLTHTLSLETEKSSPSANETAGTDITSKRQSTRDRKDLNAFFIFEQPLSCPAQDKTAG